MIKILFVILFGSFVSTSSWAQSKVEEEFNPFSENVEEVLNQYDQFYFQQTGQSPFLESILDRFAAETCVRGTCRVWLQVVKSTQLAYLFIDGQHIETWKVSTGKVGFGTPNFDRHPEGRIYDSYSSKKFPGGDYAGLGNMPYAVFIQGGFAVHGTPEGNWSKLGSRASHGCIRMHPENGRTFNRLVREYGVYETWITVQD